MHTLNAHCSNKELNYQVSFELSTTDDFIDIQFQVLSKKEPYISNEFKDNSFDNWGLWDFDVVEVFLTYNKKEYIELQVSPLNQNFALKIIEPREIYNRPDDLEFKSDVVSNCYNWNTKLRINKSLIPGHETDHKIFGNLHAILGQDREHYSYNVNTESKPDFHRIDLFKELIC